MRDRRQNTVERAVIEDVGGGKPKRANALLKEPGIAPSVMVVLTWKFMVRTIDLDGKTG